VRVDDAVQDAAFGVARLIPSGQKRHARDIRRANGREQCRKSDTSKELGAARTDATGQASTFGGRPPTGTLDTQIGGGCARIALRS
jgi:hypothetical protein